MTKIVFYKKADDYVGITVDGHTGYGHSGNDILCSAISGIVQTGVLGVIKVLKIKAQYTTDEERGFLELKVTGKVGDKRDSLNVIFETMKAGLEDLRSEYSKYMKLEVENVY